MVGKIVAAARPPLQRQLFPESIETAIPTVPAPVVEKISVAIPKVEKAAASVPVEVEPAMKSTSVVVQAIETNMVLSKDRDRVWAEANKEETDGFVKKTCALGSSGPLGFNSTPMLTSWYEETLEEEEKQRREELQRKDGPFSAPGGNNISREKKARGYKVALHARKKIMNDSARKGRMITTSRLTLSDYALVAKPRTSKATLDKGGIKKINKVLVVREPPMKD
ncbi:unnamed protein product [Cochlearia groenlandica]